MKMSKNNMVFISMIVIAYVLFNSLVLGLQDNELVNMTTIQLVFIGVSISPVGEAILRFIYGARLVKTNKDKERLLPIFNEVYESIRKQENYNNYKIKLYIDKSMTINAYAMGTRTIAITRGAIEGLTDEQIKGIFAHEFGHIIHGDTLIPLILIVGNLFFLIAFMFIKIIQLIGRLCSDMLGNSESSKIAGWIINTILNVSMFLIVQILQILILINQRSNEYQADDFALKTGYGEDLLETLYILDKIDLNGRMSLLERIKSSHPNIRDRISKLEKKMAV